MKPFVIKRDGYLFAFVKTISSKSNYEIRSMDFCQFVRLFLLCTFWVVFIGLIAIGVCLGIYLGLRDLGKYLADAYEFIPNLRESVVAWQVSIFHFVFGLLHSCLFLGTLYLVWVLTIWTYRKVRAWLPQPDEAKQQTFLSAAYDSVKHKYCIPLEFK